jgi:hypothetical protein
MDNFVIVVIEGMHPPQYTAASLATIAGDAVLCQGRVLVFSPSAPWQVLSGWAMRQWLEANLLGQPPTADLPPLIIWAFSAGCVGMASLVAYWQRYRQPVLACFALDGWGVPLSTAVPTYRLSHDRFTHETSQWLGGGPINFYADPAIPHHQLWRSPQTVQGWQVTALTATLPVRQPMTAAEFLCHWSHHHLMG